MTEAVLERTTSRRLQPSARIARIRERLVSTDPVICHERAQIWTETYRANEQLPPVLRAAVALRETLARMSIHILEDELIVGNQGHGLRSAPLHPQINTWFINELDLFEGRKGSRFEISGESKESIRDFVPYWKGKTVYERTMALLSDEVKASMESVAFTCNYTLGKGTGHFLLNFGRVLTAGFAGIRAEVQEKLSTLTLSVPGDLERITFCKAVITVCDAAIAFAGRYAEMADQMAQAETDQQRRAELRTIAEVCRRVPEHPAESFHEALQSIWLVQLITQIESDGTGVSLGRLDYILDPYYRRDFEAGNLTREHAAELLESFWLKLGEIIEVWPQEDTRFFGGHPISQTITLGGTHADGTDATNEVTWLCLDAHEKLMLPQPSICARVHKNSPHDFLMRCAEVIRWGGGMPAMYNDEIAIPSLMMRGVSREHARLNFGVAGCVEMGLQGQMCHFANSGYLSFLKILEVTLHNGRDPRTGKQIGPRTGDPAHFTTFDELLSAYRTQIAWFMEQMAGVINAVNTMHGVYVTLPFVSSFTEDCVGRLKEVHDGGALYNHDGPQGVGLADAVDSLAAIRELVFDRKDIGLSALMEAVDRDYAGSEELRQRILRDVPKYGNNEPSVDRLARDVASFFCREVEKYRNPRGGIMVPGLYSVSANVPIGQYVGPTPNGRKAHQPVAEACSPTHGADRKGPTQAALSVAHLDHLLVTNGTQYNQRYHPAALEGVKGLTSLIQLIQTFFEEGGYHIQFNVVSTDKLRDAMKRPEKYRDLVVRVAGYSAFFVDLDPAVQEDIILRTELSFG